MVDDPEVGDHDCFRYGGYYWVFRDGYWYRSSSWRGHFVVISPRFVPAVFYEVPSTRWKHHPSGPPEFVRNGDGPPGRGPGNSGPPGQEKKGDRGGPPGQEKKGDKGHHGK